MAEDKTLPLKDNLGDPGKSRETGDTVKSFKFKARKS